MPQPVSYTHLDVYKRQLLILDEPSLGLAPNIVDDILEVAKTMVKNDGISVPVSYTHLGSRV